MTPKQHFRALQIRLEIAEFGMGMPLDRERVKELREQVEQARKDATNDNALNTGYDILSDGFEEEQGGILMTIEAQRTALVSMPVPKPTLSQVIIEKIREGATLEETKQYYAFLREIQRDEARIMFDADFVVMQGELPEVPKLGRIDHGGGRGYNYARWEDINDRIKPVLQRHGFGLRFDIITETESLFEIEAILVHRSGYSICTRKKLPIDKSGSKNIVQAYGSTQSYAQRYSAIALLNLTSRNEDTDATDKDVVPSTLTFEQSEELTQAILASGRTLEWFYKFSQLDKVSDLPPERFDSVLGYMQKLPKVDNAAGQ